MLLLLLRALTSGKMKNTFSQCFHPHSIPHTLTHFTHLHSQRVSITFASHTAQFSSVQLVSSHFWQMGVESSRSRSYSPPHCMLTPAFVRFGSVRMLKMGKMCSLCNNNNNSTACTYAIISYFLFNIISRVPNICDINSSSAATLNSHVCVCCSGSISHHHPSSAQQNGVNSWRHPTPLSIAKQSFQSSLPSTRIAIIARVNRKRGDFNPSQEHTPCALIMMFVMFFRELNNSLNFISTLSQYTPRFLYTHFSNWL